MAESAVRFFAPDHPQLARTLAGRLKQTRAKFVGELASGYAKDWADYRERIGTLNGLNAAIEECEASEKEMNR